MRESWRPNKDCNILTPPPAPPPVAVRFFFRSSDLLDRGPWGPASLLRAGSHRSIWNSDFKLWTPTVWLPISLGYIIVLRPLNSTHWQSRLSPDLFDRMHLLFTQVHFSFGSLAGSEVNMQHYVISTIFIGYVLHFCREAVGVLYSLSRLHRENLRGNFVLLYLVLINISQLLSYVTSDEKNSSRYCR